MEESQRSGNHGQGKGPQNAPELSSQTFNRQGHQYGGQGGRESRNQNGEKIIH